MRINKPSTLLISFLLLTNTSLYAKEFVELDCLIKPEMYVDVSSPVVGVLSSVLVNKSDTVVEGQILATLDTSVETARVAVAKQETVMTNQIEANKIRLEYALRKEARVAKLKDSSLSEQEYDDANTEAAVAKTELLQTRLEKKKNELKLVLAKAELQLKIIKSPVNGIVVERYLVPGESTNNKPILQLAKIDPLLVDVVASYELFDSIEQGMEVEIWPDFPAGSQYKAVVSVVDRIIDAASGSFSIRLALPNPDNSLIGGTKCMARFPIKLSSMPASSPSSSASSEIPNANENLPEYDKLPDDIKELLSSE